MYKDIYDAQLAPPHPGEVLREDVLPRLDISRKALAKTLGISPRTLADVLAERRAVGLDLARRLSAALGTNVHFWLGLQMQYDLWAAQNAAPLKVRRVAWHGPTRRQPVMRAV